MARVTEQNSEQVRVDSWLWAARIFKSRSRAKTAVTGGKVHVNGNRVKPSRPVRVGETLEVTRGQDMLELVVKSLASRRGPASGAALLYEETAASVERRKLAAEQRARTRDGFIGAAKKPDRNTRRKLRNLKSGRR